MSKNLMIKELPLRGEDIPIDPEDLGKCGITGLFRQSWKVNGTMRSMLTYIPRDYHYNRPCLIVAGPEKEEGVEFLEGSGLKELADGNEIMICLLEPLNQRWNPDGSDGDFMNAAYKKVQAREYYVVMQDCIYGAGFEEGIVAAQQAAVKMTSEWSGFAFFGEIQKNKAEEKDTRDSDQGYQEGEMFIAACKSQLPVWFFRKQETEASQKAIRYWKGENHSQDEPLYDEKGTRIYQPYPLKKGSRTNDDNIAQVRVTEGYERESLNAELLNYMWKYIGAARRHRGYGGKILRYYRNPGDSGAEYHTMTVDGFKREWYEYVPDRVKEEGSPVPLVVVMHGRGGNGETFFDISDMSVVAEERKFIAVFPTSDIYQVKEEGLRNVRLWNGSFEGKDIDSLRFIRAMVEDVKKRNVIDGGRVYACGQSSGGYMTSYCAMAASDIFTAVSPWSGYSCPGENSAFGYDRESYFQQGHVPYNILIGDRDGLFPENKFWPLPDSKSGFIQFIRFLIKEFQLCEKPGIYTCYPVTYYEWHNSKGTPMLRIGVVDHMPHANYAEESRSSYDEFLSRFSKRIDGTLLYMGHEAE